jgi:hypothetical protein
MSVFDLPSRLVYQFLTSPVPNLRINRITTAIKTSTGKLCIIIKSVLVVEFVLAMVTSYQQETLFLVADQRLFSYALMVYS